MERFVLQRTEQNQNRPHTFSQHLSMKKHFLVQHLALAGAITFLSTAGSGHFHAQSLN